MTYRILIADDQIPADDISIENYKKQFYTRYGKDANRKFLEQCIFMREVVENIRDLGYNVTTANEYTTAIKLIENNLYDLAIVDLGWYIDTSIEKSKRAYAGWTICDKIDYVDKHNKRLTPKFMFSSRFPSRPELSYKAAQKHILPIYKEKSEFVKNSLLALISFVELNTIVDANYKSIENRYYNKELQEIVLDSLKEPLNNYRNWTTLTIIFVSISLGTLIFGIILAYSGKIQIGIISSIASTISSIVSSILYKRLKDIQKSMENSRNVILTELQKVNNKN